ncbi:MAG: ZIP family metal transporter [Candidatus Micrarchaeota archaeon]|nr:ZIP family metal transporter [Candidatus Micrarchaeota archaeon]
MANEFLWIAGSAVADALLGFVGVFSLWFSQRDLEKISRVLMSFAAGTLLGGAFLHLLPESLEKIGAEQVFLLTLAGFVLFIFLESYFHWHRCKCGVHPFSFVMLAGDGVHNFLGGITLAASFLMSVPLGIATIIAIIAHEFPQQLGIFGVLVRGGFSRNRAMVYSFLAQSTIVLGAIAGYFLAGVSEGLVSLLVPFAAGNFIYIASSDLIPEMHKSRGRGMLGNLAVFMLGLALMWALRSL